jgi:chemotaxis receptor (MCP) glutamine deamidase CheD
VNVRTLSFQVLVYGISFLPSLTQAELPPERVREIETIRATLKHQQDLLANAASGAATYTGPAPTLIEKALHSSKAVLLSTLTEGRASYEASLALSEGDLDRRIALEERLLERTPPASRPPLPCPAQTAVAEPLNGLSEALANVSTKIECPGTPDGLQTLLKQRTATGPNLRGNPILYESPFLRVEDRGSFVYVFAKVSSPGDSFEAANPAAMLRKSRLLEETGSPAVQPSEETREVPMTLEDRSDCVVSALIQAGRLIPREPTSGELEGARAMAQIRGRTTGHRPGQTLTHSEANALDKLEFAPMFAVRTSSGEKPLVGTWGLGPCVGVSLWNPDTRTASVVHLDPTQDIPKALREMLGQLGGQGQNLQARIIGGWTNASERTLMHARAFLAHQGISIVQEDTLGFEDTAGSRGFILDSRTGQIYANVKRADPIAPR